MGGLLGVIGKWIKRAKMIYCIQDFNPEQIKAVEYITNKWLVSSLMAIDKFCCRHSDIIITVGRDLVETLNERFKHCNVPKCVMINNWINEKEVYPLEKNNTGVLTFRKRYGLENKFVIMYSGNIGLYYDLENLIKIIEKYKPGIKTKDGREIVFAFVGAGALLNKLMNYKEKHHMDNVVFIPYQDKKELVYSLNAGDVHWVTNAKGIKGCSVPSKAYGVWSVAKPLIGVLEQGSEIRLILEETKSGKVSDPGAYEEIASNIDWFIKHADDKELSEMGNRGYDNLKKRLTKDASIQKYIETINMI